MMSESEVKAKISTEYNVSRETMNDLETYVGLLQKWNPAINLVSKASLMDVWARHLMDSIQLFGLMPPSTKKWVDLGSGGGFPGLIVAILAKETAPDLVVNLIESDSRKCTFLRTVSRETKVNSVVIQERIEKTDPIHADVLSARALAPLDTLLGYAERHLKPGGTAIFPKGENYRQERDTALETWRFQSEEYKSKTNSSAVILKIGNIKRV